MISKLIEVLKFLLKVIPYIISLLNQFTSKILKL